MQFYVLSIAPYHQYDEYNCEYQSEYKLSFTKHFSYIYGDKGKIIWVKMRSFLALHRE